MKRYQDDPHAVLTMIFLALAMAAMLIARGCKLTPGRRVTAAGQIGIRPPCACWGLAGRARP